MIFAVVFVPDCAARVAAFAVILGSTSTTTVSRFRVAIMCVFIRIWRFLTNIIFAYGYFFLLVRILLRISTHMNADQPQEGLTSDQLNDWLLSLDLKDRREKIARILEITGKEKRTLEGWRAGRTIPAKYIAAIRSVMTGGDKIRLELDADVLSAFRKKAEAKGMSVERYLSELLKLMGCFVLLGIVAWQAFAPDDHQIVRKFGRGRRRDDIAAVEEIDTDGGEG